ncbi:MAG: hypothetical protein CVT74_11150 [Alphaproteobacteria bacterium HGW-Alphaproteobacteria-13]|jgi:AcrR family transcriptional regulator|nr:MAG: hypothetical protein CVT74_11150 [Alphaproteobacteria bacterium HGW-Alphaproteobacteria-13]
MPVAGNIAPRKRRAISRSDIVLVSSTMFQERGYDRTSLEDIARALSVTKPSLYYHFASKEDILLECVRVSYVKFRGELAHRDNPLLNGRMRAEIFLRLYLEVISQDMGVSMVIADDRVMSPSGGEQYLAWKRELNNDLESRLKAGIQDGSIDVSETHLTSFAIFGMFNWVAQWKVSGNSFSVDEMFERFTDVIFNGIGGRR